jgi:hypothetical protein
MQDRAGGGCDEAGLRLADPRSEFIKGGGGLTNDTRSDISAHVSDLSLTARGGAVR